MVLTLARRQAAKFMAMCSLHSVDKLDRFSETRKLQAEEQRVAQVLLHNDEANTHIASLQQDLETIRARELNSRAQWEAELKHEREQHARIERELKSKIEELQQRLHSAASTPRGLASPGYLASPRFPSLYLCPSEVVALSVPRHLSGWDTEVSPAPEQAPNRARP